MGDHDNVTDRASRSHSRPLPPPGATQYKGRALIVDDDDRICLMLTLRLTHEGYSCQCCSDGDAALQLLKHEAFDLVISDLQMPKVSGMELLQKASKMYSRTVFLIATGVDDVRTGVEALKLGAYDYLVKPFQLDAVVASLERALERKQLELELELENYRQNLEVLVSCPSDS